MNVVASISYTKRQQIGQGQGMNSEVFVAFDPQLSGEIVVKEVEKSKFVGLPSYFAEAQVMYRSAHDNIVPVHYACETPTHVCIAMPYFKNGSLSDRISDRSLPLTDVLALGQGVLSGVGKIHLAGFLHFDIKPSNVLYSDTGVPMVADFGQARVVAANGLVTQAPPMYRWVRPPETFLHGVGAPQSDLFQVGLLLYRAVNGDDFYRLQEPVIPELRAKVIAGKFPNRKLFMPHVPKRLRTVVRKALKLDPVERFQSATEFADELARVPIVLDWRTEPLSGVGTRWTADRQDQPSFVVDLLPDGSAWKVEIHTAWPGEKPRARDRSVWKRGLSKDDALAHLKQVFEQLQA